MSDEIHDHSKSPAMSWTKRPLARTKPVDSFSELCQQLTNVVAQQTALSDKLIEAFREAKDHNAPVLATSRLSAPNLEALRFSPSPDDMEELKNVHFNHPIGDEDNFREVKKKKLGLDSFNLVTANIETIRSCLSTVIHEMRMVITGQIPPENQQDTLTNIFALLNVVNNNCNNCRSGLNGVERLLRSHEVATSGPYNSANTSEKGTQTKELVDSSESDPDDKDSGLESNPSRQSESGNGTEDFRIYTDYDQLMESSIPQEITKERPKLFFKSKMVSLPDTVFEPRLSPRKPKSGTIDGSDTMKIPLTESDENQPSVESLENDVIITVSQDSHDAIDSTQSIPLMTVGSLDADEDLKGKKVVSLQSLSTKMPKRRQFQRSKTIDTTRGVFDDEDVETSFTSSTSSPKVEKESDFDILEKEVNQIRFQCSTSSYSSQSRRDSLQSLVFGTRKRISTEMKTLVQKLTQHRRRSKGNMEKDVTVEEMIQAIGERIDQLMQTSQYFGAILHETQHSSEKENLINYIDMIKTLHRPTSIPSNGTFNIFQRTDSDPGSDNNDRSRCVSPTTTGFSSYKTIEASYQRGFSEGVSYMRDEFEEDLKKSKNYVKRFDTVSDRISSVVSFEVNSKYSFLYGSGAYFALIAAISFLFILIL